MVLVRSLQFRKSNEGEIMAQVGLKNSTQSTLNKLQDTAKTHGKEMHDDIQRSGSEMIGQAKEAVTDFMSTGSDRVRGWMEDASGYLTEGEKSVRQNIQRHPMQAILIGLGVGAAIGMLFNLARNRG
jgi:ElaB/YqjD/DUF883 family membrane-anchored ribosome-binding protein